MDNKLEDIVDNIHTEHDLSILRDRLFETKKLLTCGQADAANANLSKSIQHLTVVINSYKMKIIEENKDGYFI